jgi:hypothetical protein
MRTALTFKWDRAAWGGGDTTERDAELRSSCRREIRVLCFVPYIESTKEQERGHRTFGTWNNNVTYLGTAINGVPCKRTWIQRLPLRIAVWAMPTYAQLLAWSLLTQVDAKKRKDKAIPVQAWTGPWGTGSWQICQSQAPSVCALREIPVVLIRAWVDSRAIVQSEGLRQLQVWTSRDLPACSAVSQSPAPLRAPDSVECDV